MQLVEIWRFPVKSLGGETLDEVMVGPTGIEFDRSWGIVDLETGLTLTGRREPSLLLASARVVDGEVVVRLPDGDETVDSADLSSWLGRDVELRRAGPSDRGTFEISLAEDERTDWVQWEGGDGSFHDSGRRRITIVSEASLREWDRRRFRLNLITDGDPTDETALFGQQVQVGECRIDMIKMVDRCVMVTRPQPGGVERDLSVLTTVNRELGGDLGVGGTIVTPGRIAVGDAVESVETA
ncbi:MAG: MOSC N-terminal beta barrel domain-containing protein [Actinomycetota bacterium]